MHRAARVAATLHVTSLGLWAGVIAMTAAAAAAIFPVVKTLDPVLPNFNPATQPHWLLIAGRVAASIFTISHGAQTVLAILALISGGLLLTQRAYPKGRCRLVWLVSTSTSLLLLAGYLLILWSHMREHLHTYWSATKAGNLDLAVTSQAAFRADHPTATALMGLTLLTVLTAVFSFAWVTTGPRNTAA